MVQSGKKRCVCVSESGGGLKCVSEAWRACPVPARPFFSASLVGLPGSIGDGDIHLQLRKSQPHQLHTTKQSHKQASSKAAKQTQTKQNKQTKKKITHTKERTESGKRKTRGWKQQITKQGKQAGWHCHNTQHASRQAGNKNTIQAEQQSKNEG